MYPMSHDVSRDPTVGKAQSHLVSFPTGLIKVLLSQLYIPSPWLLHAKAGCQLSSTSRFSKTTRYVCSSLSHRPTHHPTSTAAYFTPGSQIATTRSSINTL